MRCCCYCGAVRRLTRGCGLQRAAFAAVSSIRRYSYPVQPMRCVLPARAVQGIEVEQVSVRVRRADDLLALCGCIRGVGGCPPERRIGTGRLMSATLCIARREDWQPTQSGLLAAKRHVSYLDAMTPAAKWKCTNRPGPFPADEGSAILQYSYYIGESQPYLLLLLHPGWRVRFCRVWGITLTPPDAVCP